MSGETTSTPSLPCSCLADVSQLYECQIVSFAIANFQTRLITRHEGCSEIG
jgi:hypothetical protein